MIFMSTKNPPKRVPSFCYEVCLTLGSLVQAAKKIERHDAGQKKSLILLFKDGYDDLRGANSEVLTKQSQEHF
jgi:hypothetical protein